MKAVRFALRLRGFILALLVALAAASPSAASTIACAPLILPDGHTIPGPCEENSWFPQPPWWYLPLTPPAPEPPPLPPYAFIPDPGPLLPPSDFFLFAYEPGWTPPDPVTDPPAYSLFADPPPDFADPPNFADPAPEHAPEPGGLALIGLGLLVLGIWGRCRKAKPHD